MATARCSWQNKSFPAKKSAEKIEEENVTPKKRNKYSPNRRHTISSINLADILAKYDFCSGVIVIRLAISKQAGQSP